MRISVIAAYVAARQPVSPVPHPSPSCYYPAVPDRRFYSLRSKKSCCCQHGISAHHSKKTPQRTRAGFPAAAETIPASDNSG